MATFAIEMQVGTANRVMSQLNQLGMRHASRLDGFSYVLNSEIWVVDFTDPNLSSGAIQQIPEVVGVEGQAEHIFYALPPMAEATEPGIELLTPDEIGEILSPYPDVNVARSYPLGAPGFFAGENVGTDVFRKSDDWDKVLEMIGAREAWQYNRGEGAVIGIIDSGCDMSRLHSDQVVGIWNEDDSSMYDEVGHGTMVALSAASKTTVNGFEGVAPEAGLIILKPKPTERRSMGTHDLMRATDKMLWYAIETNQRVIVNNSWGLFGCKNLLLPCRIIITRALVAADRMNLMLSVWAIGNNNMLGCDAPVNGWCMNTTPVSFSVGACDLDGVKHTYSSVGGQCYPLSPIVVGPTQGVIPWGSGFKDFRQQGGGSSAAAPLVSGALAILVTEFPDLSNAELRAAIRAGAYRLGADSQFNAGTGSGILRIDDAIQAAPTARKHPTYDYEQRFLAEASTLVD
jgi:subtilisin family serine protease|tara:strand:+ start:999 stop:2372 length:1374 start_codon:yes stop_codon:yes gene_type:complete